MDTTLSFFFNYDRTFATLVERKDDSLWLRYVDSTNHRLDIENINSDESHAASSEINKLITNLEYPISRLTVTLPAESLLVTQFPGSERLEKDDLKKLVNLEVRKLYPQFNFENFVLNIVPMVKSIEGTENILAVLVPNDDFKEVRRILQATNQPISNIDLSQLNAHNAHSYNYPEEHDKNIILLSIQKQFIDFSITRNGSPLYYNVIKYNDDGDIAMAFEEEITKVIGVYTDQIDGAYYFGSGLTKDISMMCWEVSMMGGFEGKRLNPFRMMKTTLDDRTKEYCSRVFHLFPACVGAAMPPQYKRILLYK